MVDTRNKVGSHGRGGSRGGQEISQGSVRQGGEERSPEQPSKLKTTIEEKVAKTLRDVLPTLLDAQEESNQK